MPLNIEDPEEKKRPSPGGKPTTPPLPDFSPGTGSGRKGIFLWILIAVVGACVIFLLVQYGVIPTGGEAPEISEQQPAEVKIQEQTPVESAPPSIPSGESKDSLRMAELSQRLMGEGKYTIFISAFRSESDAEDLVVRWMNAGYQAFVQRSDGWFRVGLGRYPDINAARQEAENLKQAFEVGYWIGMAELP